VRPRADIGPEVRVQVRAVVGALLPLRQLRHELADVVPAPGQVLVSNR
jgi:hypothetical protein